jgi:hypothetical protein
MDSSFFNVCIIESCYAVILHKETKKIEYDLLFLNLIGNVANCEGLLL